MQVTYKVETLELVNEIWIWHKQVLDVKAEVA
jgi:hypothetical protein